MLTLHHAPQSRSTRMLWLLEEVGAPYSVVYTDIPRMDGTGGSDPANPHPDKKVPALVDDGVLVTESVAICLYLTDKFPEAGIGPRVGDPLRGAYVTWLAYYAGVIEPVVTLEFAGLSDNPMLQRTYAGRAKMDQRILDAIKAGPFMLGERFSAIDILIASMGQWARKMLPAGDLVDTYIKRASDRPALQRSYARDARPADPTSA
jgi:glutathione S-transferase